MDLGGSGEQLGDMLIELFAGSSSVLASVASWRFTHRVSAALPRRCGL